jgi:hypothetical protein
MSITTLGTNPVPIVQAGQQPVVVYNRDIANSVIFGPDSGIGGGAAANSNEYSIIDPLGSVAFDGSTDIYASTLTVGTTANVDVITGATDVGVSPLLIAEQINVAGVFAVNRSTVVSQQSAAQTLPVSGGAQTVISAAGISQQGYEISFGLQNNGGGGSSPFVQIDLLWTDSATGQTVARERWYCAYAFPGPYNYMGTGPTKGDTLQLTMSNLASAGSGTTSVVNFSLVQNSRTYPRDDWRSQATMSVPTFTSATYDQFSNVLFSTAPTVGGSSNTKRILPLYSGAVQISFVPGGTNNGHFVVNNEGGFAAGNLTAQTVYESNPGTNNAVDPIVFLPRAVCSITLFNDVAGAVTLSANGTIAEQPA